MSAAGTIRSFSLSTAFVNEYKDQQPEWGYNGLGYIVYKRTYARTKPDGNLEEFWETCERVVEGTYDYQKRHCKLLRLPWDDRKAQRSAQEMFKRMWAFKWLPPGRGLWMMGTENVDKLGGGALNNCFSGSTEFLYKDNLNTLKIGRLEDFVDTDVRVYVDAQTTAVAKIQSFGEQQLNRVVLKVVGRSKYSQTFEVTGDHRWLLASGEETTKLAVGDTVVVTPSTTELTKDPSYPRGFCHGLIFGDGTRHTYYPERHFIRLCGAKEQKHITILETQPEHLNTTHPASYNGDAVVTLVLPKSENWKQVPADFADVGYLRGFIDGWLAADSHKQTEFSRCLDTSNADAAAWLCKVAPICGYAISGWSLETKDTNFGPRTHPLNRLSVSIVPVSLRVTSIAELAVQPVYCAVVPDHNKFMLAGGIVTGNCGYVSTSGVAVDFADPFCWLMDMLMLGVGVGFDTKGTGLIKIQAPAAMAGTYVVDDSREGWVSLLRLVLNAYVGKGALPESIDYSKVRPAGSPIRGFGGVASGPDPLRELVYSVREVLDGLVDQSITQSAIVDISTLVGRCVVSGNVRRSATIAFGEPKDEEFLNLKNPVLNKEALEHHRWAANDSVFAEVGMDYTRTAELTAINGEPGYQWMDNARKFGRMNGVPDFADMRAAGANPCVTGDTWIHTADGPRQVLELVGKPFTALVNGVPFKSGASGFWKTGKKEVFTITSDAGYSVDATANHLFLVNKEGKELWIPVENLNVGDLLVIGNHRETSHWGGTGTFSEGYLAGHLLGDGTLKTDKAVFSVWEKDGPGILGMMEEVTKSIETLSLPHRSDWCGWSPVTGRNEYRLNSASVKKLLETYGMSSDRKCPDLKILEEQSSEFYRGFLRGLFDTDGSVQGTQTKGVSIRLTQVGLPLVKSVHRMLARLGVVSSLYENRADARTTRLPDGKGGHKDYACQPCHELIISKDNLQQFSSVIGFSHGDKVTALQTALSSYKRTPNAEKFLSPVESIVRAGVQLVYDAEIQDAHRFDANGVVIHNCVEQTLEDRELCCLVETFPGRHESFEDYKKTLKYAYLYAKTVTLIPTHDARTNTVMMRNRRIGCSMSGIVQAMQKFGRRKFFSEFCDKGYQYLNELDTLYSDWFCVRESIKITSVKPSGSVSLLPGVTPGIHFPHSEYYLRRIRLQDNSPLVAKLRTAGYPLELDVVSPNTVVATFPVHEENFDRAKEDLTMWEQLEIAAQMQQYWADNQVSVTVTFKPFEAKDIKYALELYETRLKGVSFLPLKDHGYAQAPYETITAERYEFLVSSITPIVADTLEHEETARFCDGESCSI